MNSVIPAEVPNRPTRAFTVVLETSIPLPSFPLAAIMRSMSERWDDHAAEDLVSGYLADLSDSIPSGRPMDPPRAAEANRAVADALAERDVRLLERALLDAQVAWCEAPAEGYQPPELEDFDE